MANVPYGIKFLQGGKQAEEETVKTLEECCKAHPNGCGIYRKECRRLYSTRCNSNPRDGGWKWGKTTHQDPTIRYQPDVVRYCNWMPVLRRPVAVNRIRESIIGGMR